MSKSESEKKQARVGLASNFIGIAAGTAATAAALRNPALRRPGSSSPGPVTGRALRAASGRQGRVARVLGTPRGRAALIAAGAGGALGLQVANLGGDLVANRVLSRESKIGKSGVDEKKGEAVRKSIEQSVVSKAGTGPVTGHGTSLDVTYGKRDSSKWIQGSEEGKAVQRAVLRDKRRWAYYGGGDAATLGALGLGFGALKAKPGMGRKALIGGAIASGIGGLGLGQAANVRDYKVANRAREEYGFPKRSRWAGKQVVGKRYYSAESDRQRRMGAAAGLLGGTAIVTGAAAGRGLVGSRGINPKGEGRVAGASLGYLIPKGASAKKVLRGRAALAATSAVTGVGGVAAYKHGISQRNRSWE